MTEKANRPKIVAITNDAASPLASEADIAAMIMAGPEVAALG
jgi:glucosamine 6-phosphate synthetase-like amidotransferase/phosphosugar isomerase protein